MTKRYAVEVVVPALGKTLEFMIPSVMDMASAKRLMISMISEQYKEMPEKEDGMWLIDIGAQKRISSGVTCGEAGIKDGSRLMLVWIT